MEPFERTDLDWSAVQYRVAPCGGQTGSTDLHGLSSVKIREIRGPSHRSQFRARSRCLQRSRIWAIVADALREFVQQHGSPLDKRLGQANMEKVRSASPKIRPIRRKSYEPYPSRVSARSADGRVRHCTNHPSA